MAKRERLEVTGIICPKCKEFIWSRHRHDFRPCSCNYCYVDGGQQDYIRFGFGGEDFTEPYLKPEIEQREIELTEEDKKLTSYEPRWPY